ncbi:Putative regulatory protein [Mycobacteroides abscessus]|nr:Putative regulatory protein [Mycobacteroides abscessus]
MVLDPGGTVVASHPRNLDVATVNLVRGALSPGASAGAQQLDPGITVSQQAIGVGGTAYGVLAVVSKTPLTFVDQVLLGHANSLLALDFDKPSRLQEAQRRLNGQALGLLLGDERNLGPVWAQLGQAADARGRIRVLVVDAESQTALVRVLPAVALSPGASAGVQQLDPGITVSQQAIGVGGTAYGVLAVVSKTPLTFVDQVLLGHANSLLALDFDKPSRLQEAQRRLNGQALGLLLGDERNLGPVWAQLGQAADARGRIRVLVVDAESQTALVRVLPAVTRDMESAGYPVFAHTGERQLTVVLPGSETADFARRLFGDVDARIKKGLRAGLSAAHPVGRLADAVQNARLAASVAERGGTPLEFTSLAGSALLSFGPSREVLVAVANATLEPVAEHDAVHGSELMTSLRAYLEANGHWESAATVVGVHRHTLRKRIETVQSLLACDLDIARVRAELLLAMLTGTPGTGN